MGGSSFRGRLVADNNQSDDALLAAFAGGNSPAVAAVAGKKLSNDDLLSAFAGGVPNGPAAAPQKGDEPGIAQKLGAGLMRGVTDVGQAVGKITGAIDRLTMPEAMANKAKYVSQYAEGFDKKYGDSTAAAIGRAGGNIAASAPLLMAGGGLLGAAGETAATAFPAAARGINLITGATEASSLPGRVAQGAVTGAAQGSAGNLLSNPDQPMGETALTGAVTGGIVGAALPGIAATGRAVGNHLSGGGVNPARANLAEDAINRFGIPIRGSQISESPFVKYMDSVLGKLPGTGYVAKNEQQAEAFARAVSKTFGEDTPAITPDIMQQAKTRIGNVFDRVAANSTVKIDNKLLTDLGQIESEATTNEVGAIGKNIKSILDRAQNGEITGDSYQAITRRGAPLSRAMKASDPNVRFYAGQVRDALDDALERHTPQNLLSDLKAARAQYKNLKTIEDLAEKAGVEGQISAPGLLQAVRRSYDNFAYNGGGDIGKLARIGQEFIKEPPSSGTAERHGVLKALSMLSGGAGIGALVGNPLIAAAPLAAGASTVLGARGLASALGSDWYRNMLLRSASGAPGRLGNLVSNPFVQRVAPYGLPAAVIAGNRLMNHSAPPGPPLQ